MPIGQIRQRYPRLVRALIWLGLSEGEAVCTIHCRKLGIVGGAEIVDHVGGCQAVLTLAVSARHAAARGGAA